MARRRIVVGTSGIELVEKTKKTKKTKKLLKGRPSLTRLLYRDVEEGYNGGFEVLTSEKKGTSGVVRFRDMHGWQHHEVNYVEDEEDVDAFRERTTNRTFVLIHDPSGATSLYIFEGNRQLAYVKAKTESDYKKFTGNPFAGSWQPISLAKALAPHAVAS